MRPAHFAITAALGLSLAASAGVSKSQAAGDGLSAYQGAWVLEGRDCADVYTSSGKVASFKKPVDIFAPAFLISGKRLRTPMATCSIKSVRPTGDRHLLVLDCTNAVAGQEVKVYMAPQPNGVLRRYYDVQDPAGTGYRRCSQ
ncbi:hypothetical protein CIW48_28340 [Methylobacterium sp. P1-11]|uniref:hypothetical protein n=1 Tax=Methylobacterium sp. P1-11 TaxID=2024616 RepID=UPI0011ECDAB1|nr:hypothetical protein [Methylobacterium sp. P1-11]KAA0114902.1 hypothetical protein CIW48_28340 [Methylobacterium sp. P1-11]